jgi:ABC-type branched-subunit amino acid transport system permease subunit
VAHGAPPTRRRFVGRVSAPPPTLGRLPLVVALTGIALAVAAFFVGDYWLYVLGLLAVHIIVTTGLAILFGYSGLLSVGQAGFVAIGAYTTSLLILHTTVPIPVAVFFGGLGAGAVGLAIGIPVLRLTPIYLAAVTFGFGEIVRLTATHWRSVTRGGDGLTLPLLTTTDVVLPLIVVAGVMVALGYAIVHSSLGRAMRAVRDSEIAVRAIGVSASRVKVIAFAISGFYAGIAGGFFGLLTGHVSPDSFGLSQSLLYLTAVVIGGLGTLGGPIIGAIGLGLLNEATRGAGVYRDLITGVVLLSALLLLPGGLSSVASSVLGRLRGRRR